METVAEKTAKGKRGRPRLIAEELEAFNETGGMFTAVALHPHRSRLKVHSRFEARGVLGFGKAPRFLWRVDAEADRAGTAKFWRPTILSELGRIEDPKEMMEIAAQRCQLKPATKTAVALIGRYRTGQAPAGDVFALADAISRVLMEYRLTHPGMSWDQVQEALETTLDEACAAGQEAGE